ncbi:MAG: TRAP transporter substrate-binding protein DctP [Burkholderiales bacterium]|nr:TRAP transporter substrate-binding protein DctP [Burkholderiales bacterium]
MRLPTLPAFHQTACRGFALLVWVAGFLGPGMASAQPGEAAQGRVVLSAVSWLAPTHPLSMVQTRWCAEVLAVTAGRVACRPITRPMASATTVFEAVRDGRIDLAYWVHGYLPQRFALTRLAELPFSGDSAEATSVAYQRIHERHLARLDEHQGIKVLAVFTHGPGMLFSTRRPMASMADLTGLSTRVGGGITSDVGRMLRLSTLTAPIEQTRELLESGGAEALLLPAEAVETFGLQRLLRHRTALPGGFYNTSFALVMSPAAWGRIGAADRQAIEALSGEVTARAFGRAFDQADRRALAGLQAAGVPATRPGKAFVDEVRTRSQALEQRWLRDAQALGLDNAAQVLREFRAEAAQLK